MSLTIVEFGLGPNFCGLPIAHIKEVLRIVAVTHLPEAPKFVEGVVNLRGTVIPVIDMRKRLGLDAGPFHVKNRILVVPLHGRPAGLIVDEVHHVAEIGADDMGLDPGEALGIDLRFLSRVVKADGRLLAVLDLEKVLSPEEGRELREAVPHEEES